MGIFSKNPQISSNINISCKVVKGAGGSLTLACSKMSLDVFLIDKRA